MMMENEFPKVGETKAGKACSCSVGGGSKPASTKKKCRTWEKYEEMSFKKQQGNGEDEYISTLSDAKPRDTEREVIFSFGSQGDKYDGSEWIKVEAYVDSAAVATVMQQDLIPSIKTVESEGLRNGYIWWSASGHPIRNEGQKVVPLKTTCGKKRRMTFQIAKVSKPLVSVDALNETGHDVV